MSSELMYQITMLEVKKFLDNGIVSREKYAEIDTIFRAKYRPIFGTLFSEIS